MFLKKLSTVFDWFHKRAIHWVLASAGPQQCILAFAVTGGGTGTDVVTFASKSMGGQACPDMADTNYIVLLGETITSANPYVSVATKTVSGFSILGLTLNEVVGVVVIGRAAGMDEEL